MIPSVLLIAVYDVDDVNVVSVDDDEENDVVVDVVEFSSSCASFVDAGVDPLGTGDVLFVSEVDGLVMLDGSDAVRLGVGNVALVMFGVPDV